MNNQITYFSADFRGGKVTIAKTIVPAGWFVTWMLNNYYADDTAARLSVFKNGIWTLQNELLAGICRQETMQAALEDIRNITTTLSKTEPFVRLDLSGEQTRLDDLFSDKSYEEINELLAFRRKYIPDENVPQLLRNTPGYTKTARLREYENRLSALSETLAFYDSVGDDMTAMRKLLICFVDQLSGLKKLDENSLLRLALSLFPESDRQTASTALEYIGIRKKPQSKTAVTARRMIFSRYRDFLMADLFEGIANGHFPQKCGICGRYFLMQSARHQRYCDGIDPKDPKERTCRKVAASLSRETRERYEDHPIKQMCVKRLNTIRKHLSNGKITEEGKESAAYQVPDPYPVPDSYLPLKMITDEIIKYILQLDYRDRVMFVLSIGMCDGCWNELPNKDKRTYDEIAHDFELRSPQAVGDNRRKVTEELRKILKKHEG